MLSTIDIETKLRQIKPVLAERFHVSEIGYFGSYVHGQQTDNSDLDLVVEFSQPVGWSFFTLEQFLEQSLGLNVDLITKNALKERIKESILNQVKYI
jgi:predicted nucleotidyltransferase